VPRRDCSARRGHDRSGGDHHAARGLSRKQQEVPGKRTPETAPRLDRRADDDELGVALRGHARDLLAEAARPRPHDLAANAHTVCGRDRGRRLQALVEVGDRGVEVGVQGQLALEHGWRDQHDPRAAVGREPAGEVERVLGLLLVEQRDDDGAVRDRLRPQREAARAAAERSDVRQPHRNSW
jgi:hypothetical protein